MKDGVPDGRATRYYPNGAVQHQGTYKAGAKHGLFHHWDDQGVWQKQELYVSNTAVWTSSERSDYPPEDVLDDESVSEAAPGHNALSTKHAEISASSTRAGGPNATLVDPAADNGAEMPSTRFLNGLPAHGSFAQVSMGRGSSVTASSAQRMTLRGSYAEGQLGASVALTLARFADDTLSAFAKPVADAHVSYLIPYVRGVFVARAGLVLPLGNDDNTSALAGAASVVQAPNDAIYVLPSTVATRGSLSWYGTTDYVIAQADLGIDIAFFGYPDGVHPIIHANSALGVGMQGFFVGVEGSTALAWTGTLTDVVVWGGAAYGTIRETTIGLFAGSQGDTTIIRVGTSYDF